MQPLSSTGHSSSQLGLPSHLFAPPARVILDAVSRPMSVIVARPAPVLVLFNPAAQVGYPGCASAPICRSSRRASVGSKSRTSASSRNSTTSIRRWPLSRRATNDWYSPSRAANCACVSPAYPVPTPGRRRNRSVGQRETTRAIARLHDPARGATPPRQRRSSGRPRWRPTPASPGRSRAEAEPPRASASWPPSPRPAA